jgi:hypothetical protein
MIVDSGHLFLSIPVLIDIDIAMYVDGEVGCGGPIDEIVEGLLIIVMNGVPSSASASAPHRHRDRREGHSLSTYYGHRGRLR